MAEESDKAPVEVHVHVHPAESKDQQSQDKSEGDQNQKDDKSEGKDDKKDKGKDKKGSKRNYAFIAIFAGVGLLAAIGVLIYYLLVARFHESTKDAYVNGNLVRLQPQVSGTVTLITADQTQPVQRGQILVALDRHDAEVSLDQSKANLALTLRQVVQLFAEAKRQRAMLDSQRAQLTLAQRELDRDRALIKEHGVSQEELDRMQQNEQTARAGMAQARASLESTLAQIEGTKPSNHPRVLQAEANLRSSWLALNRTEVRSPFAGYVVRRDVQLGAQVTPATQMLAIVPLDTVWIDANFKETQLKQMRIGQPVSIKADIYGSDYEYHGRVLGLTAGTGAVLAVLPPENATGNWIKIVQRLPVRIGLDARELDLHPLFLGLSTKVNVDLHDLSGASLSVNPAWDAQMHTDVYAEQDAGVDAEIRKIVDENLPADLVNETSGMRVNANP
jgi:membrane fusion protein (multidrug efflux system)